MTSSVAACRACGYPAGSDACQAVFQDASLRVRALAWTDSLKTWRLMHDVYNVQHAETQCVAYSKFVLHLGGICVAIEHAGQERGYRALHQLVEQSAWKTRTWPPDGELPRHRGSVTAASLAALSDAPLLISGVDRWARSTWVACAAFQPLAREWVQQALLLIPSRA